MDNNNLLEALSKSMMGEVDSLKEVAKLKEGLIKDLGFGITDASMRSLTTHLNE